MVCNSALLLVLLPICLQYSVLVEAAQLPLRTKGRYVVDAEGRRVKLACTNWYGAHLKTFVQNGLSKNSLEGITSQIVKMGFNCVRLSYSTEAYVHNPLVQSKYISKLENTTSRTFFELFDETVDALTNKGLMVLINNHNTYAGWCCNVFDGSSIWFHGNYTEDVWIATLTGLARRYKANPLVVGYDLRNEPRTGYLSGSIESGKVDAPVWGDVYDSFWRVQPRDWRDAVERAGAAILEENPDALIVVEVLHHAAVLCPWQLKRYPLRGLDGHVIWSAHEYHWLNKVVSWAWEECPKEFASEAQFIPTAIINNVTHFLINQFLRGEQFLRWRGLLLAIAAVSLLVSSYLAPCRAGACVQQFPAIIILGLLTVSVVAWAVVPIRPIASYEDFAASRDGVWGWIATHNIAPLWVAEFGEEHRTEQWNWTIRYLRERDLDFAYWSVDGEHFPSTAAELGHDVPNLNQDETYGLLDNDYQTVRHAWKLHDLQSLMEVKPSVSDRVSSGGGTAETKQRSREDL